MVVMERVDDDTLQCHDGRSVNMARTGGRCG